jgi:hypothetical protein
MVGLRLYGNCCGVMVFETPAAVSYLRVALCQLFGFHMTEYCGAVLTKQDQVGILFHPTRVRVYISRYCSRFASIILIVRVYFAVVRVVALSHTLTLRIMPQSSHLFYKGTTP